LARYNDHVKEADIQAAILDYLRLKGRFFFRCNSGAFKTQHGSFIRFGTPGAPDLIGCVDGKFVGLEVKTEKGNMSEAQKTLAASLRAAGGQYHVVRSIDDLISLGL
jgi:hypothetical protein